MHKVLIVENNPVFIKLLLHALEEKSCECRIAEDGLQAMIILQSFQPDIVITDIIMPNISGDQLCRIIRDTPRTREVFLVVFSAILAEGESTIRELDCDLMIAKGPAKTVQKYVDEILATFEKGIRKQKHVVGIRGLQPRAVARELLSVRDHYSIIFDNLDEAVVELTTNGDVIFANNASYKLVSCTIGSFVGSKLLSHLSGPPSVLVGDWFDAARKSIPPPFISDYENPLFCGNKAVQLRLVARKEEETYIVGIIQDISGRKAADALQKSIEEKLRQQNIALEQALLEIKQLTGILPLCSFCKKIRNSKDQWEDVDVYIHKNSAADISHSICPDCAQKHYPEYYENS